jgi:hypothetical protein
MPPGWRRTQAQDGTLWLYPPEKPPQFGVWIVISKSGILNGDFRTAFNNYLQGALSVGAVQHFMAQEGYPVLYAELEVPYKGPAGMQFPMRAMAVAANPGDRFEAVLFVAYYRADFDQYRPVFGEFVKSLDYVNARATRTR